MECKVFIHFLFYSQIDFLSPEKQKNLMHQVFFMLQVFLVLLKVLFTKLRVKFYHFFKVSAIMNFWPQVYYYSNDCHILYIF